MNAFILPERSLSTIRRLVSPRIHPGITSDCCRRWCACRRHAWAHVLNETLRAAHTRARGWWRVNIRQVPDPPHKTHTACREIRLFYHEPRTNQATQADRQTACDSELVHDENEFDLEQTGFDCKTRLARRMSCLVGNGKVVPLNARGDSSKNLKALICDTFALTSLCVQPETGNL